MTPTARTEAAAEADGPHRGAVPGAVRLIWLPVGAGGHFVKHNGRALEAIVAQAAAPGARPLSLGADDPPPRGGPRHRDGADIVHAMGDPVHLSDDPAVARRMLALVPGVPTPVWGRDELRTGDMWNSNSLTSWLIILAGLDIAAVHPPAGGRAPGWDAGVVVARRMRY
jgi:hypothetical protein